MKLIIAIVGSENLEAVESALNHHRHASLLSISQVFGTGREPGYGEIYRGRVVHRRRPKLRLEIFVQDQAVDATLEAVVQAGSCDDTGLGGDCKAVVIDLGECA